MGVIIFILTCAVAFAIWQNWRLRKKLRDVAGDTDRHLTTFQILFSLAPGSDTEKGFSFNFQKFIEWISGTRDIAKNAMWLADDTRFKADALQRYFKLELNIVPHAGNGHGDFTYFKSKPKPKTKKGKK